MDRTERDLLAAIIADPDDDLPRFAYADWLEEHGQPERGEFIRIQLEQAKLPEPVYDPPRTGDALPNSHHALYNAGVCAACLALPDRCPWHEAGRRAIKHAKFGNLIPAWFDGPWWDHDRQEWYASVGASCDVAVSDLRMSVRYDPPPLMVWKVRRGFVAEAKCTLEIWGRYGKALCASHPVESVEASDKRPADGAVNCYPHRAGHGWYRADVPDPHEPEALAAELWDLLEGWVPSVSSECWKLWATRDEAILALSRALLALAGGNDAPGRA